MFFSLYREKNIFWFVGFFWKRCIEFRHAFHTSTFTSYDMRPYNRSYTISTSMWILHQKLTIWIKRLKLCVTTHPVNVQYLSAQSNQIKRMSKCLTDSVICLYQRSTLLLSRIDVADQFDQKSFNWKTLSQGKYFCWSNRSKYLSRKVKTSNHDWWINIIKNFYCCITFFHSVTFTRNYWAML